MAEQSGEVTAAANNFDLSINYDDAILEQQKQIENEIAQSTPLVSGRLEVGTLEDEYTADNVYLAKLQDLQKRYKYMRRMRGDGNCFFRAFGFAYMEQLLNMTSPEELHRFKSAATNLKDMLVKEFGYPQYTLDDFHEQFIEILDKVEKHVSVEDLIVIFNDQALSDYLVVYLRLLTSGLLQKEMEFYQNFIEGHRTVKEFCSSEVEPMGKESDHIHVSALTSGVDIGVCVEYMDRGEGGKVNSHNFPEGKSPRIFLLYRPGHYDILYKSENSNLIQPC